MSRFHLAAWLMSAGLLACSSGCLGGNEVEIPDISEAANEVIPSDQIVGDDGKPAEKAQKDVPILLNN